MLNSIIKVKLEKNCCSFEELEKFFANNTIHTYDQKGFKDSSVKLVIKHSEYPTIILTLPREGIPNSFALQILFSLFMKNKLALPIILKYLSHRNLSKDFNNISRKLQAKMDQDVQAQNDSEISKEIELCKEDILNVLNGGKSLLDNQLKQRYKAYYSLIDSEIEELKAKTSKELEDYINVNNTDIHKMYQRLNNKAKNIHNKMFPANEIADYALFTSHIAVVFSLVVGPVIAVCVDIIHYVRTHQKIGYLQALMYSEAPFLVVATVALIIAGVAYLTSCYLKLSFEKEMQNCIKAILNEEPEYKEMQNHIERTKCIDKATNTENVEELKPKEKPVPVVDNLINLSCDYDKIEGEVQPSAPPLSEVKLKAEWLYPWSGLSK